jgi:hypothetical protein
MNVINQAVLLFLRPLCVSPVSVVNVYLPFSYVPI